MPTPESRHQYLTAPFSVHVVHFKGATDPALDPLNAVLAGKRWWDTSVTPAIMRVRNDGNSGWDALYEVATTVGLADRVQALEAGQGTGSDIASGTFVESGGQVSYTGTGLQLQVAPAVYWLDGVRKTTAGGTITLAAADPSNPRKDLIILDSSGPNKVTGVAAASPVEPVPNWTTQARLTVVDVAAGATTITVTEASLYLENTEWTFAQDGGGVFNAASTLNPLAGTKDIEATAAGAGNYFTLTKPASGTEDINTWTNLIFPIRSKAAWPSKKTLRLTWFRNGGQRGSAVILKQGVFGFDSGLTSGYQIITVPIGAFQIPVGNLVDTLRVEVAGSGGTIGFHVDGVKLQASSVGPTPGTGGVGSFNGRTGAVVPVAGDYSVAQVTGAAPLASPAFTGTPTMPTAAPGTNTTQGATTAFVKAAIDAVLAGVSSAFDTLSEIATYLTGLETRVQDVYVPLILGDGVNDLATGVQAAQVYLPAGVIQEIKITGKEASGSVVIDIWADTYGNFPPTIADTIVASAKPTISAARVYSDSTLTGWSKTVPSGGWWLYFNIESVATFTQLFIVLKVRR